MHTIQMYHPINQWVEVAGDYCPIEITTSIEHGITIWASFKYYEGLQRTSLHPTSTAIVYKPGQWRS